MKLFGSSPLWLYKSSFMICSKSSTFAKIQGSEPGTCSYKSLNTSAAIIILTHSLDFSRDKRYIYIFILNDMYQSIGVFIDGGYYAKINEALESRCSANVNVSALMNFIRKEISSISGAPLLDCHITENHYFRGRYRVNDANNKHLLFSERKFEDSLIENDVIFHYKHLREIQKGSSLTVIEKGVDVWFALEAYELALFRKFDYVVLITGDADHEMLIKKLKALKINVLLLTWNVSENNTTSTSKLLKEEACMHVELSSLVAENPELFKTLCARM